MKLLSKLKIKFLRFKRWLKREPSPLTPLFPAMGFIQTFIDLAIRLLQEIMPMPMFLVIKLRYPKHGLIKTKTYYKAKIMRKPQRIIIPKRQLKRFPVIGRNW